MKINFTLGLCFPSVTVVLYLSISLFYSDPKSACAALYSTSFDMSVNIPPCPSPPHWPALERSGISVSFDYSGRMCDVSGA